MTKCKLAIVNNNNKINHLEDTLSFMFGKWFLTNKVCIISDTKMLEIKCKWFSINKW